MTSRRIGDDTERVESKDFRRLRSKRTARDLAADDRRQSEGAGVYPPQEEGVYAFTPPEKIWKTSIGNERYRRDMYTYFYRSAPYPMLETFDVPKFNATCTR